MSYLSKRIRWSDEGYFYHFMQADPAGNLQEGHAIHKSKHTACLLAFAQLVGVYDPEKQEVVE